MRRSRSRSILVALLLAGCSAPSTPTREAGAPTLAATAAPPTATSPTPVPTRRLPPSVARVLDLDGEMTWGIVSAGETLWVEGDYVLHHIDAASGEELRAMPGVIPTVVGDTLWFERDGDIVEADAATGEERAVYNTPVNGGTAVRDGILWAAEEERGVLARVDLAGEKVTGEVQLPDGEVKWVGVWEGAVWVVVDGSDVVVRVDPDTMAVTHTVRAGYRPHTGVVGFGSLWVIEHELAEVLRLDPRGTVEAKVPGPGINVAITVADGHVWASSREAIMKIDPATNRVVDSIEVPFGEYYGMAFAHGSLWVTTGADGKGVYEIPIP